MIAPTCHAPLPDGSRCHACRIYAALIEAERVVERTTGESAPSLNLSRCLGALGDVMATFMAELNDEQAFETVWELHRASRQFRAEQITGEEAGAGHA